MPAPGAFDYAFRHSRYGGASVYGDLDGSANGYSPAQAGNLGMLGVTIDSQVIASDPASTPLELTITASSDLTTRIGM